MPVDFNISQYLDSPTIQGIIFVLRIIFIAISALLLGFIIFALFETSWLKRLIIWDFHEFITYRPYGVKKLYKQWQKIKAKLSSGLESDYKMAITEADSILEDVLKKMGFAGETLTERLEKVTEATINNLPDVIEVHKIRNSIVHDPDYKLALDEARFALETYEKALTNLQAL
jgi:hypothetical protein